MFSMFLAQNMRKFLIILIFRFWHLSFDGGKIKKFEFCNKKFIMASVIPQNFYSYLIKHYSFPHHIDINNPLSKKYSKFRIFKFSRHKIKQKIYLQPGHEMSFNLKSCDSFYCQKIRKNMKKSTLLGCYKKHMKDIEFNYSIKKNQIKLHSCYYTITFSQLVYIMSFCLQIAITITTTNMNMSTF